MELRALRTFCFLAAERGAEQYSNRYSDGQPDADVAGHDSEHRAQSGSQGES
jgi:hypothetical protein